MSIPQANLSDGEENEGDEAKDNLSHIPVPSQKDMELELLRKKKMVKIFGQIDINIISLLLMYVHYIPNIIFL